jgi:hypothetical protein
LLRGGALCSCSQLTIRLVLIFIVFIGLRFLWDLALKQPALQTPFADPETINPEILKQIHDTP